MKMMTDSYSNLFNIIISILAIVVSLVSMVVSIVHATITQGIAQNALNIESFRHKKESFSYVKISCSVWQRTDDGTNAVHIDISNNGFGIINIESIEVAGFLGALSNLNGEQIKFPLELKMNGAMTLRCEADAIFKNPSLSELERIAQNTMFTFCYLTETGIKYEQLFSYSRIHKAHIGQPREL